METKNSPFTLSESDFLSLLTQAQLGDQAAMLQLVKYFEPDMIRYSRFIQMPKDDALQSLKLALIEMIRNTNHEKKGQA